MTNFVGSLSALGSGLLRARRNLVLSLGAALMLAALIAPVSASGLVLTGVGPIQAGVAPRISGNYLNGGEPSSYANPQGNPVVHGSNTWVIYWDPKVAYHNDWVNKINEYMAATAANSGNLDGVAAVDTQYTDKTNVPAIYKQIFRGSYHDFHAYPSNGCEDPGPLEEADLIGSGNTPICITSAQMGAEVESFIAVHGLPKGVGNVYYVLTPPAVTVCLDGGTEAGHCSDFGATQASYERSFCSYHAALNPGGLATGDGNTILYGVIPWTAGGTANLHLVKNDRLPGTDCQDGGIDPSKEFELEEEPADQEPNQQECPTEDGGCDVGLADLIINQLSLEQQNIVTNPLLNGWQDENNYENTDECRFNFSTVLGGGSSPLPGSEAGNLWNQEYQEQTYFVNTAFNYAAQLLSFPGIPCMPGVVVKPRFTSPSPVNPNEIVGFDGMESDITQTARIGYTAGGAPTPQYATYSWNFGDGTPIVTGYAPGSPVCEAPWLSPCAASIFHSYASPGVYHVTLTATDVGGNQATIEHTVTVSGTPSGGGGAGAGAGAGSSSGGGTNHAGQAVVAPVAAAAVISHSLKTLHSKGLLVRYSVNEQVAGRFEVLMSRKLAKKLHLGGPSATHLPAGTPAQVVIAKAILVTTKGGHATLAIKLGKVAAGRLSKLHKASMMLRLVVRNAATQNPATATVLSTFTLGG